MKKSPVALTIIVLISCAFVYNQTGKPWQGKMQQLPGRLECEYYDQGGEGVAYHDTDSINNGSGKLNPANGSSLNEFRMKEGVYISYTKTGNIDNNPYNKTLRDLNKFYVGWTQPGEWINYTIKVNKTGTYPIGILYTSNGDGTIAFDVDGKDATGPMKIISTHDNRDTVQWRQWHHWNACDSIGSVALKKGVHVLTLHILTNGNMNLDYINFGKGINKKSL
ncbi:carbohydrate-binding protein [Mucilaginibacter sp. SMC90]|uniref:carbohydrate-binding protein n=1 Tax=Mucilaginibacter sp. SMC90 TaxID=2929803 RepID=UPI001FB32784|nr:carbohydrate-binding protein [Mucilaginibacter sp. SMC90]UOE46370.1 carbohydrate-binding protein [Mucilaginibacter sp. SMC90]